MTTLTTPRLGIGAAMLFLGTILAANHLTTHYGMVPVGFGLTATAGTYLAGCAFVLRDAVQDTLGRRWVAGLIILGAALSFAIYTPLRRRGYVRAAVASNLVGAVVDTSVFLGIAGFPVWASLPGQLVGKAWATLAVIAAVGGTRAVLRQPVNAEGA